VDLVGAFGRSRFKVVLKNAGKKKKFRKPGIFAQNWFSTK